MQPLYLVCGVPGSGKTWVCKQLSDKFYYVPHDQYYKNHALILTKVCATANKPVITECPFAERVLREDLEKSGIKVIPYFVVEEPTLIAKRYEQREGKPFPKNNFTRASSIVTRAKEWQAYFGSSESVFNTLNAIP